MAPNLAGMLQQGGQDNPEYPWRQMEADLAKTQMLRQLQAMQDEALKKQELERGMEEQKLKQEQLKQAMSQRALQGWAPPPGTDVGGFSQGGAPMQDRAIGPGMEKAQPIEQFDKAWSQDPAQGELAEMIKRQLFFPKAEPSQLELPGERAARLKQHDIDVTNRAMATQEEVAKRAEKRTQAWQAQRDKEQEARLKVGEGVAEQKAYQADMSQAQKAAFDEERQLRAEVNKAKVSGIWSTPARQAELRSLHQAELSNIRERYKDRLFEVNQKHGYVDPEGAKEYAARGRFVTLSPELLAQHGISSFDKFKAAAAKAGVGVEDAIAAFEKYEEEVKGAKSK